MAMYRRKYTRGEPLSIVELIEELGASRCVYLNNMLKLPEWMAETSLGSVMFFCKRGIIYRAIPTKNTEKTANNNT